MTLCESHGNLPPGSGDVEEKVRMKRKKSKNLKSSRYKKLVPLPTLRKAQPAAREVLFIKKCRQCCYIFDFNDPDSDLKSKDVKTAALYELEEYILDLNIEKKGAFLQKIFPDVFKMFTKNVFRTLPPSGSILAPIPSEDVDETTFEPAWPHLNLVYDLFLHVLQRISPSSSIERHFDHYFIVNLLKLFDSEDPRERDYCKTILHKIYSQCPHIRSSIRKQVSYIFYTFIYETEEFNGIAELLEMWVSVINGMAIPLREEHRTFMLKILLPLYKVKSLMVYNQPLSLCVQRFMIKDSSLVEPFIKGLLKIWPLNQYYKEIIFLDVIEEILDTIEARMFKKVMVPLFYRLSKSMSSLHFHVVERALAYWNNEYVLMLIGENAEVIFPIVIPALYKNYRSHWNLQVDTLIYDVMKSMSEMDPVLYQLHAQPHIIKLQECGINCDLSALNLNTNDQSLSNVGSLSDLSRESYESPSSTDENDPPKEPNTHFRKAKGRFRHKTYKQGKYSPRRDFKISLEAISLSLHDTSFIG